MKCKRERFDNIWQLRYGKIISKVMGPMKGKFTGKVTKDYELRPRFIKW